MTFEQLIVLFQRTHIELQARAAKSVDTALVVRNWLFGWYVVEYEGGAAQRAELYGKELVDRLSRALKEAGVRGCSPTNLRKCREFYQAYPDIRQTLSVESPLVAAPEQIQQTASATSPPALTGRQEMVTRLSGELATRFSLGWSHYVTLLTIRNADERRFYEIEAVENSWSVRELKRQIASSLYERLALSRDKAEVRELAEKGHLVGTPADIIKSPYVLEFLGLDEKASYSEHQLETALIDKLEHFLLELGKGFLFEARQRRFTFDDDHFYVDLVFYNRLLRCYVLIDLKREKLTHQDLGQMQMYVNYFDRHVKLEDENPTVGIILCKTQNDALVELTLPEGQSAIFAKEYQLYLPDKALLRQRLMQWGEELGDQGPPEP